MPPLVISIKGGGKDVSILVKSGVSSGESEVITPNFSLYTCSP